MRHFAFKAPTLSEDISRNYHCDETELVKKLIQEASLNADAVFRIKSRAYNLVEEVRRARMNRGGLDAFMMEYDLSCDEGIALMCLAEALLRIPDSDTVDALIQDKISKGDWEQHLGQSGSMFVNAATWSLMLTGKLVSPEQSQNRFKEVLRKFFSQQSEGIIRKSVSQAMKILGRQFVMGETIDEALNRAKKQERIGYRYSYDMLGEAARTDADALYYFKQYENAIHKIGQAAAGAGPIKSPGISIKLSALLSRYEVGQYEQAHQALYNRTKALALLAKKYDLNLTIDAEEANRLELSLTLLERLALDPELDGWQGLGLAVQAYQKRALPVLKWLKALAEKSHRRLMVRLVKGAYWDSEIKYAQTQGLPDYPVFTRKVYTDVSYQACAKFMLAHPQAFYCQFATHNAYTLSMVLELIGDSKTDFEFQCLHGMGDTLYDQVVGTEKMGLPCRVYAPVGTHQHLLAYLVRRLLENGANSSFVNRIINAEVPIEDLLQDPIQIAEKLGGARHSKIPTPRHIYGTRLNSKGMELAHFAVLKTLNAALEPLWDKKYAAVPLIAVNIKNDTPAQEVHNPADHSDVVGHLTQSTPEQAKAALEAAGKAFPRWNKTSAKDRAECLRRAADLLEERMPEFMMLAVREAGKTWSNAIAEVREAIDFCRYYADMAEHYFSEPTRLPGPTGELNLLYLSGKGPMVCISPWNFPLAIFLGQVTAALAAGNPVLAKSAEHTPIIAYEAVKVLHEAGVPQDVLQFVPGRGSVIGAQLIESEVTQGVIFTGSTETAQRINGTLAAKKGPIGTLIAETGGQNCMIVDSTALPEQVTRDAISSAFDSAGQRCSALRVLYLQEEIADSMIQMIIGAMKELNVGNPEFLATDVGPVIDKEAEKQLKAHITRMKKEAKLLFECELPKTCKAGTFVPPTFFEIESIQQLKHEVFGPVLHVLRFARHDLDRVIAEVNSTGFGLTFGLHSRLDARAQRVAAEIAAGNIYINRNTVGAVVGVQPFGGQGLSGTGPKAGGPHYLLRLATEKCVTIDTTASGGNASLMTLQEEDQAESRLS